MGDHFKIRKTVVITSKLEHVILNVVWYFFLCLKNKQLFQLLFWFGFFVFVVVFGEYSFV